MKSNDLRGALEAFLLNNPDLPKGEEPQSEPQGKTKKLPRLIIRLETKGRNGKPATIISGFDPDDPDTISRVAADLKKRLATGGSHRDDEILIQGDRRKDTAEALRNMGYRTNI